MRFASLGRAYNLSAYLARRPSGSLAGSATVCAPDGGAMQTAVTPTLDAVNTTLSAPTAKGARELTLTSVVGLVIGRRYLCAGPEEAGGETVTLTSVAGSVATLAAPVRRALASGATFQGVRMTVAITTASTATARRGMRVEWLDPDTNDVIAIPFDVVTWTPRSELTIADVRTGDAQIDKKIPGDTWLPDVFATAWDTITDELSTKDRVPGSFAGVINLTRAHTYLVRALLAENAGADFTAFRDDMRGRFRQELERSLAGLEYSRTQDASTKTGDGSFRGITLQRS